MITCDHWPEALFGGLLWGDKAVRFIYMDEAGTSAEEPITIIIGVIVDADRQLVGAEALVREILGGVPKCLQHGFVFHATDVWNDPKYRADWPMAARLETLKRMMTVPRRLNLPLSFSMVRRTASAADHSKLTKSQMHHIQAFAMCAAMADRYVRDSAGPQEVATIVAEDVPEMRRYLSLAPDMFRKNPLVFPADHLRPTEEEKKLGYMVQGGELRITRIRKAIHFVEKSDDLLTLVADACAFGLRRYFCELDFGKDFAEAIFSGSGPLPLLSDYEGPSSASNFRWPRPGAN